MSSSQSLGPRIKGIIIAEANIDFNDCFICNQVITNFTYDKYVNSFEEWLGEARKTDANPSWVASLAKAGPVTIYHSSEDLEKVSKEDTLAGRLTALKTPVLAIYGENNKGLWTSEKKIASLFQLVYIPKAGHEMMIDNPNAFYSDVTRFINELK